ncbi:MAG TPA: hypothetical protein PLZ79_12015, partial [Burkholderiales bacterium]|nr:hypothetical protein [Burkholderiales bacterium]
YWSEYSADGRERYCMSYAPVPTDANGRRVVRIWGGRKHVRREENGGICDPEVCPEYQAKHCNLTGRFIFFVPGINSIHPLELGTNSFYSMQSVRETLEQIAFMRGGRISGFLDGRQQTFFMTKKLTEVPHIDEKGMPVRVKHYLISLEAAIDPTRLLRMNDDEELRLAEGDRAAAVLSGGDFEVIDGDATEVTHAPPAPAAEKIAMPGEAARGEEREAPPVLSTPVAAAIVAAPRSAAAEAAPVTTAVTARPGMSEGLAELNALLETMGIAVARFEQFAAKKWGRGWNKNPNGIRKAHAEVAESINDPSRLADRMTAELEQLA